MRNALEQGFKTLTAAAVGGGLIAGLFELAARNDWLDRRLRVLSAPKDISRLADKMIEIQEGMNTVDMLTAVAVLGAAGIVGWYIVPVAWRAYKTLSSLRY